MKKHQKTALFVGRFQPFHVGHLDAITQMVEAGYNSIIILIGSAQYSRDDINPLTFEERRDCISQVMKLELPGLTFRIIGLDDIHDDDRWVEYTNDTLKNYDAKYEAVFTGNALTDQLFSAAGATVVPIEFRKQITATQIREALRTKDNSWREFVHPAIQAKVEEVIGSN